MLNEGKTYSFKITKETEFPDGERFYVLLASDNSRHLLPYKTYFSYGFALNTIVKCKVDKINCTGRIFLEPEHPVYMENGTYRMQLIRPYIVTISRKIKKEAFLLRDGNGKEFICIPDKKTDIQLIPKEIKFKLLKISKGVFHIQLVN